MLELATLNKFDSQGMFKIYDKWPEIAKESYENKKETTNFENIDNIIFVGMGGSGTMGDVFSAILSRKKIHISIVKGYRLPKTIDAKTLVVFTSITGNTSETLYVLDLARKLDVKTISFSNERLFAEMEFQFLLYLMRCKFLCLLHQLLQFCVQNYQHKNKL